MNESIDISNICVSDFLKIWTVEKFNENKNEFYILYQILRGHLNPCIEIDIKNDLNENNPFSFIFNGLFWENIILPIFKLNDKNLNGRYHVLTNNLCKNYHFVIYDTQLELIYDPTYEKFNDVSLIENNNCTGIQCTKLQLGNMCNHFDLRYYFEKFNIVGEENLILQIKEVGSRLINSITN